MKTKYTRKFLLLAITVLVTIVFTGCPSSREGSGTGVGNGPARVVSDSTKSGQTVTPEKSRPNNR